MFEFLPSVRVSLMVLTTVFGVNVAFGLAGAAEAQQLEIKSHIKIENPAELKPAEALSIYQGIADELSRGYAASRDIVARTYRNWQLFNAAPYRSATHGNRYVNNYANEASYGKPGAVMPPGTILAKDSFTVTAESAAFGGALFLMEKLVPGASPENGDWRYTMIMPDGSILGDSKGENPDQVKFCHACHAAKADNDYLFFVPKAYRVTASGD
jgi:hypothetical protein